MLTVNELFSGIGTQALALEYLGIPHKIIGTSEIEKNAIEAYNILHGESRNYGDISKIEKLDYADLWTYSFPCLTGDTLILTNSGYKQMIDVDVGDEVYTHKGRFKPILKKFDNGVHEIWEVKTANVDVVRTTKNHKFYVVSRNKKWNSQLNKYEYFYSEPYWKECCELTKNDYVLSPTYKQENKGTRNSEFYWVLGKFVGDGWLRFGKTGIVICCSKKNNESLELEKKLKGANLHFSKVEERTTFKYHICSVKLYAICEKFGRGALNKRLPIEILNLEKPLLKAFIEGYLFADGCKVEKNYKITSVSRELLYGIGVCVTKCYNVPFRLYKNIMPKTHMIEGRLVNQNDFYQLVFDLETEIKRTGSVYLKDNYWYKITDVKNTEQKEQVYDIEVEEDHSMVANSISLHNCQDLSSGGKGKGVAALDEDGNKVATRSGLLWEVERLLAKSCGYDLENGQLVFNSNYMKESPKYLLLENVPELIDVKRHRVHFEQWVARLTELGYYTSVGKLNALDFGVPQNRERVFCLSVRKDVYSSEIDYPFSSSDIESPKHGRLEDFVDKEVLEYKGPLMIDPKISDYLLPAYTRDIEAIKQCSEDFISRKDIWTCKCKSGFQDHRVGITCAPTIRHQNQHTAIFVNNQIHKLTACECWKFMGIKEKDFWKVKKNSNISDSILCGLAGNAIVVPVLMSLFNQIWRIENGLEPFRCPEVPFLTKDSKARL